jgi:hypothetical protein
MKIEIGVAIAIIAVGVNSMAAAQSPRELNPNTAAERAQQGSRAYNLAVPQGCDAFEKGYCITVRKERDVEVPPDEPVSGGKKH